jgi:hypothetical protein
MIFWLRLLRFSAGFLLGFVFYPEDGGDMFLQNVLLLPRTTRRYNPEDPRPSSDYISFIQLTFPQ